MKGALIILAVTVIIGIILYLLDLRSRKRDNQDTSSDTDPAASPTPEGEEGREETGECCGLHLVCEKELTGIAEGHAVYYDDEELDRFAGRGPEEYEPEETEEFRDVLFSLLPQDVPGWARSLDRRGIRPPQEIRDELIIMLNELSTSKR